MNDQKVQEIYVEDIIPNRFQPRLTFDEKALKELADSIKIHGVIQPLVLRRVGNKYEIIAGERRYKASCMAGLKKVPAIVRDMTDNESAEVALIENVQRKNLSSIEEAKSYKNLLDRGYLTQEELAKKLGVTQSTIANKLRLLNLCDEVQNALLNEQISERHARSLLQLENPDDQKMMLNRIIKERLTVRQLDNEIKKFLANKSNSSDSNNEEGNGESKTMNNNQSSNQMNNTYMQSNQNTMSNNTQTQGYASANTNAPETNLFGMPINNNEDLEEKAPNLSTGFNTNVPPAAFNPFSAPMESNIPNSNPSQNQNTAYQNTNMNANANNSVDPNSNVNIGFNNGMQQPQNTFNNNYQAQQQNNNMFGFNAMGQPINNQNVNQQYNAPEPQNNANTQNSTFFNMPMGGQTEPMPAPINEQPQMQEQTSQPEPVSNQEPVNPFPNESVNVDTTASIVKPDDNIETFNMFGDVVDPNELRQQKEEEAEEEVSQKNNFGREINSVRDTIQNIQNDGYEVESEEYDFEDVYQIVIKIKKENEE